MNLVLKLANTYVVEEPSEDAPADKPVDHLWRFETGRIMLERRARPDTGTDAGPAPGEADAFHYGGLDSLKCPFCTGYTDFVAIGRWGDPLTLHCRCGTTLTTPDEDAPDYYRYPHAEDGRLLMQRLILRAADPLYEVRQVYAEVLAYKRDWGAQRRAHPAYLGPDVDEVVVAERLDLQAEDPTQALLLWVRSLHAHPQDGRDIGSRTRRFLRAALALQVPGARDSDVGRCLIAEIRELGILLREESARWAHTRELVMDRVRAWQAEDGGSQQWQDAWAHTVDVVSRLLEGERVLDGLEDIGCAALTMICYIISREQGIRADHVSAQAMQDALGPAGGDPDGVAQQWQQRLQALGHDLNAPGDPVARLWRHLRATPDLGRALWTVLPFKRNFSKPQGT